MTGSSICKNKVSLALHQSTEKATLTTFTAVTEQIFCLFNWLWDCFLENMLSSLNYFFVIKKWDLLCHNFFSQSLTEPVPVPDAASSDSYNKIKKQITIVPTLSELWPSRQTHQNEMFRNKKLSARQYYSSVNLYYNED